MFFPKKYYVDGVSLYTGKRCVILKGSMIGPSLPLKIR